MHRFFEKIDCKEGTGLLALSDENSNHVKNVLRLAKNDKIFLCDGKKGDYICTVTDITNKHVTISINYEERLENENEPHYDLTIFQAMPKSDKMELIIQKCVELGVCKIVPYYSERTIVRPDSNGKDNARRLRWMKISEAAAKQSGRGVIPEIPEAMTLKNAIASAKKTENLYCAVAYEKCVDASMKQWVQGCSNNKAAVFIGPEGGFTDFEIELFLENGIMPVGMGKRILRTETAPIVFAACFCYEYEKGIEI